MFLIKNKNKILLVAYIFIFVLSFSTFSAKICPVDRISVDGDVCPICGYRFSNEYDGERFSDEEILDSGKFRTIRNWINGICAIEETNNDDSSILNTDSLMDRLFNSANSAIEKISNSSIYYCFTGIGVFILIFNFGFSFYDNSFVSDRTTLEQFYKLLYKLIICLVIITNCKRILYLFISFCSFILHQVINFKNSGVLSITENSITIQDQIFLNIIKANNLDKKGVVDEALSGLSQIGVLMQLFIPWLLSIVAKFGMVMAIAKCAIEIVAYAAMYPIAAGDCYDNIKNSRFMSYTKQIFSCALQMSVMIIILLGAQVLLGEVVSDVINELAAVEQQESTKYFSLLILLAVIQVSKMTVIMSSASVIANKVAGV